MCSLEMMKINVINAIENKFGLNVAAVHQSKAGRNNYDLLLHLSHEIKAICAVTDFEDIIKESGDWEIPLTAASVENSILLLRLSRKDAFLQIFTAILNPNLHYGYKEFRNETVAVHCVHSKETQLTSFRQYLISEVAKNLLTIAGYHVSANEGTQVVFTTSQTQEGIYCAPVCSISDSTTNDIAVENYLRLRENDITAIAEHKYWDCNRDSAIRVLAESSVAMDLIAIKHSNVVKLITDPKTVAGSREMSNKGAAFLLYNCARLTAIEKQFEEKLNEGHFPPLPPLVEVDFSILSQEEEWQLLFNFIMDYPSVLARTISSVKNNQIGQHHLCSFLFKFCQLFSVYYRRHRILHEPKPHLLPLIFARLYLAKTINKLLKDALKILNIKVLESM